MCSLQVGSDQSTRSVNSRLYRYRSRGMEECVHDDPCCQNHPTTRELRPLVGRLRTSNLDPQPSKGYTAPEPSTSKENLDAEASSSLASLARPIVGLLRLPKPSIEPRRSSRKRQASIKEIERRQTEWDQLSPTRKRRSGSEGGQSPVRRRRREAATEVQTQESRSDTTERGRERDRAPQTIRESKSGSRELREIHARSERRRLHRAPETFGRPISFSGACRLG